MKLKELIATGNVVRFVKYLDGNLWYEVVSDASTSNGFQFPVPISDIGNATFLAEDRAALFMRYMRKHLELHVEAQKAKSAI